MTDPTTTGSAEGGPDATVGLEELLETARLATAAAEAARIRAEDSELRFESLADVLPQLIWACDNDGKPTYFNRRWREYPSLAQPDAPCSDWVDALHTDDRARIESAWKLCLSTNAPLEAEARLRTRAGVERWHLIRATRSEGPDGRPLGWTGTCTDVDDQHRAQDELIRTGEFREQLIGIIGHDLRAPLSAIAITTTKLKAHATGSHLVDLTRIHRSALRMGRMIEQVLDFTRGRLGGGIPIRRTHGSVAEVCQNVLAEFGASHPDRVFRLAAKGPWLTWFDHDRIAQVLTNLVANAVQHGAPEAEVLVTVTASQAEWGLSVLSHGNPISAERQLQLFEPFLRSRPGLDGSVPTGLGLGLYIVDQTVRAHGGTVTVTSSAEEGTCFVATFPAVLTESQVVMEGPRAAPPPAAAAAPVASGLAVLLIDDGADAAEVLLTLLTRQGHSVALTNTGAHGLEQARRIRPDVVVCDIGLPDMTGYDVVRVLRADPVTAVAYFIALTGFSRRDAEAHAVAAGFDALVTKPVDLDELESLLRLGARRADNSVPS